MSSIVIASAIFLMVIIGAIWITISREENTLLPYSNAVFVISLFWILFYVTFLFTEYTFSAYLFSNLYYSCTIWLLMFLHLFTRAYVKLPKIKKRNLIILISVCIIDTIFGMINVHSQNFYDITRTKLGRLNFSYWKITNTPIFIWHFVNGAVILIHTCALVIKKTISCPKIYREDFIKYLLSYIAVILVNILVNIFNFPIDISIIFFIAMADTLFLYPCVKGHRKIIYQTLKISANNSKTAIFCFDETLKLIFINEEAETFFETAKLLTKKPEIYIEDFISKYNLTKTENFKVEETIKRNGENLIYEIEYKKMYQNETYIGCLLSFTDRTQIIKEYEAERYRANHDALTGLFNREYFYERANEALKAEPAAKWLMLASDIKDFKLINETQGTEVGDEVLKYYADIIIHNVPETTVYGRIGDDRFGILIKESLFNKQVFIDAIAKLAQMTDVNGYKLQINFGIYRTEFAIESSMLMFDKAELAIKNNQDRQQIQFIEYNPEIMKKILADKEILADFNYALRSNQFKLYLQPVYSKENKIVGGEAFVRYVEPGQKPKLPKSFLPILEEVGSIYELDRYIWREVAKVLQNWATDSIKKQWFISVNMSGKDIKYIDILSELKNLAKEFNFAPNQFKIEFTDIAVAENPQKSLDLAEQLKAEGFGIVIDHFGAEYSSLTMLRDIDAEIIKLDMHNTGAEKLSEKEMTILKNIVEMAKMLNIQVLLKKIETITQLEYLSELDCDLFQGYYYSKPVTVSEFGK